MVFLSSLNRILHGNIVVVSFILRSIINSLPALGDPFFNSDVTQTSNCFSSSVSSVCSVFLLQFSSIVTIQFVLSLSINTTQHRATLMVKTPLKQLPFNREVELKNLLLLLVVLYFLNFKTFHLQFLRFKSWRLRHGFLL